MISEKYPKGTLSGQARMEILVGVCDELRRTPEIPLFLQNDDWPYCCGDFCEYIGSPKSYDESKDLPGISNYWDSGVSNYSELFGEMTLEPESLSEVCKFKCSSCSKDYFTWQST
jgi:uncharacterized protein CbrC (UPF0167 family)